MINQPTALTTSSLNAEQREFYDKIVSQDFSKILLTGEAGCGKTYVLTQALAQLFREGVKVLLCAPTHMARINLQTKMPEDVRPYMPTSTVASLLSRHGFQTGDGSTAFTRPKTDRLANWQVIAIDEASMLGQTDLEALQSAGAKIIYTGDFAQLPTVMQKRGDFSDIPVFHLVQQMRQSGPILAAAQANRDEVVFPTETVHSPEGNVIVTDSCNELLEAFYAALANSTVDESITHRYIAHTNAEVLEVSASVRDHVHGISSISEPFIAGEYLLLYETCAAGYNGEVVKVLNARLDPKAERCSRFASLFQSYEVEVEGVRGTTWISVIPPLCNPAVEQYKEQIQERIKLARRLRNDADLKFCFEELNSLDQFWTKVGYPYAITCHKSQGQSIANVYVNTLSFEGASNKRALLYVALSRATTNLFTVKVPPKRWEVVRKINTEYKAVKERYEATFNEPAYKFRARTGLGARTPEQKEILTGVMLAAIAMGPRVSSTPANKIVETHETQAEINTWGEMYEGAEVCPF
jgi:hypothetical protein